MNSGVARVESFVLRFVEDDLRADSPNSSGRWHALITHVQTGEAKPFADFADAIAFIARYIPIGNFVYQDNMNQPNDNQLTAANGSVPDER